MLSNLRGFPGVPEMCLGLYGHEGGKREVEEAGQPSPSREALGPQPHFIETTVLWTTVITEFSLKIKEWGEMTEAFILERKLKMPEISVFDMSNI